MKKLIFFLFGYLSLLNVLQSQPVDINLSKEDRAFNDKIVEDAVAIVLGDVVDTIRYEDAHRKGKALIRFLVRVKHVYRGDNIKSSELIEIEALGGHYSDISNEECMDCDAGVNLFAMNEHRDSLVFFLSKKHEGPSKLNANATQYTLYSKWYQGNEVFHFVVWRALSNKYDEVTVNERTIRYRWAMNNLFFSSFLSLQNYLASFKDIKMPDDYGKKPNAAVVSFGGTSSNPLVTLRMAFDTLLLTTDNKIITCTMP